MSQSQEVVMKKKGTTAPEVLLQENWYWKWPGEEVFCLFCFRKQHTQRCQFFQNVDLDSTSSSMSPLLASESSQPGKRE